MRATLAASGTIVLTLVTTASTAFAQNSPASPPPTSPVPVTIVATGENACPEGSNNVGASMTPDNNMLRLTFSKFLAQAGPGISSIEGRQKCQVMLEVGVPDGLTYAIVEADYRGHVNLAEGAAAMMTGSYSFAGSATPATTQLTFRGPRNDAWNIMRAAEAPALDWLPCGERRVITVSMELRANKGTSTGINSITLDLPIDLHVTWRRCSA